MAEIKRAFSASKMNKDMDERLVPKGEYRDAMNIEINTSEGSNVGTVQTVLGNTALTSIFPTDSFCVGAIADHKTDKIYWLVAGGQTTTNNVTIKKDYIVEYDVQNASYKYVLVDIYEVSIIPPASSAATNGWIYAPEVSSIETYNNLGIRIGMDVRCTNAPSTSGILVYDIQFDSGNNRWKILTETILNGGTKADFSTTNSETVVFSSDRLLNFDSDRLITGINVLDGMLFWTDNFSEPKKINIERCIAGTGGTQYLVGGSVSGFTNTTTTNTSQIFEGDTDHFHTRLVSSEDDVTLSVMTDRTGKKAVWLEEEHITVIRKSPLTPPYLEMSSTEAQRTDGNGNELAISTSLLNYSFSSDNVNLLSPDGTVYTGADALTFNSAVDFKVGDIIMLTSDVDVNQTNFPTAQVRIRIENVPGGTSPFTGAYDWSLISIDTTLGTVALDWKVRLEQSKALFEDEFIRFAYRYKYKDGEYSTISPWSEIAFLPSDYDYAPKKGYNLGMENQLRSLRITDYVVEDSTRGRDVIAVDILLKKEHHPNIYTVKTIKPNDKHPIWPDKNTDVKARGKYEIESELIHAALPENQLLRAWDNVPRYAKAQDITANRLIYGNYVQSYDVLDFVGGEIIIPDIKVSLESTLGDLANNVANATPTPSKSVKSLRTYQVGVVYRDKYGRETPVLVGDATDSTIKIGKKESPKFNKIKARIDSLPPYWADSYKFYIKETSSEYYNLAMDRWYNAEDGNVWLSFPSAERNKVEEDTFLILKKRHTQDVIVDDKARYKVIAIENEAPDFIKQNTKKIGQVTNDVAAAGGSPASQNLVHTAADFPFIDFTKFKINKNELERRVLGASTSTLENDLLNQMHNGYLYLRFGTATVTSSYYKVANIVEDGSGNNYDISIDGKFGEDIRFLSPTQSSGAITAGILVDFATKVPENKPEFDGRFFVKVLRDITLQENVTGYSGESSEWNVVGAMSSYYVNYSKVTEDAVVANGSLIEDLDGYANNNGKAEFNFFTTDGSTDALINDNYWSAAGNAWREATRSWWRSFGASWFIDSAITANEENNKLGTNASSTMTDITDGTHGVFDAGHANMDDGGTGISGAGTGLALSFSGIYNLTDPMSGNRNQNNHAKNDPTDWGVGSSLHLNQADVMSRLSAGTYFRFADDPDKTIFTIRYVSRLEDRYNYDAKNTAGAGAFEDAANKRLTLKLVVTDDQGFGIGANPNTVGYNPTTTDSQGRWSAAASNTPIRIEFVEPFSEDDNVMSTDSPAVWETEPKERVDLDIYYEASPAIPININLATNEQFAKYGSIVQNEGHDTSTGSSTSGSPFSSTVTVTSWSDQTVTISSSQTVYDGDIISFTAPDGGVTRLVASGDSTGQTINFVNTPHEQTVTLPYSNCYSFQNGVESNRIRDDYNESFIKNGVKASAVLAIPYEEERRHAGMIFSGNYNSTSGINELNQFRQAENITKDLNPRHGSIQCLFNRETDLVAITEDRCFKILANKDAIFNANGNAQLVSSNNVLGQITPYSGNFGTINPESFAQDNYRSYFVDRTRGKVCRLSKDGITPISSIGMHDWFADNLRVSTSSTKKNTIKTVMGSFDKRKGLYNVTIRQKAEAIKGVSYESPVDTYYTISYSELNKGWVSFKSFFPEKGLSINNDYYTWKEAELWKHHDNSTRCNFYGSQASGSYLPSITAILNDEPGSIKSFNTLNYEGSQAKINQHTATGNTTDANGENVSQADGEYYNLTAKAGWYVDSFTTNEQTATIPEFIEKEGKWFNYLRGEATSHTNDTSDLSVTSSNVDEQEFSVQGIGIPSGVTDPGDLPGNIYKLTVLNNTSTTYETDGGSGGTDWDSTAD